MSGEDIMRWRRKFAWRPTWLQFGQSPLGHGRMVWLRWYECKAEYRLRAPSMQRELDNRLLVIWAATGVAFAALAALMVLLLTGWRV
jgi:hypothetical protein